MPRKTLKEPSEKQASHHPTLAICGSLKESGTQAGNRYTITLRGEAVADLVPAEGNKHRDAIAAVEDMLSFMQARARKPVGCVDLKARSETAVSLWLSMIPASLSLKDESMVENPASE
ncbi:hypothetical protein AB4090_06235 [Acidithiobacillus sp. IBUN Pt1247-S3]|uniref:hypothetical protein n=1 Tax=Acidithiobacillus sp. IBUN Pt1247-S3 TaxID=3166642 RepID=UPI0034E5A0E0